MKQIKAVIIIFFLFLVTACAKWGGESGEYNPFEGVPAKKLYSEAKDAMAKEQYASAIKRLEALETMYPFNNYAEQAQMDLIYAYYKNNEYPAAAATAERFIHLYPRAKHVDYAYYMKGLANFQQSRGTLSNLFPLDEAWRDPGTQSQAYSDFATLIQQFPQSQYKANALQRMIYLRNMFAKRELNIANYYFERQMYVAAAERASYLIKTYPQAPSVKAALSMVYHANKAMGLQKAADDAMAVYMATYHCKPEAIAA